MTPERNMTNEFAKWVAEKREVGEHTAHVVIYDWLTALFELIDEEEAAPCTPNGLILNGTTRAVRNIKERFGIQERPKEGQS